MKYPAFSLIVAVVIGLVSAGHAVAKSPLLIKGKTALYQKILTRPGARLTGAPGSKDKGSVLPAFSILYVYDRIPIRGGSTMLSVGPDARGTIWGLINERHTVRWRHSLILAFTPRAGRKRVLFFRDRANLKGWLQRYDLSKAAAKVRSQADTVGQLGVDSPIVSIEPQKYVDFKNPKQFYVLPILDAKSVRLPNRKRVMGVRIASVTRNERKAGKRLAPTNSSRKRKMNQGKKPALGGFRAGIAFVIDASSSMQPYIDETREVVREVLDDIRDAGLVDGVRVGVIGYRDDPTKVRGIEYLARTFADPNDVIVDFSKNFRRLKASRVSTRAFAEDAFAGIDHSIHRITWDGFDGRILVLITDASARDATSPYTTIGLNATEMRNDIQGASRTLPTFLFVLHLKTPEGRPDHPRAEAQYKELSRMGTGASLYFPVKLGDRREFRRNIEMLSKTIVSEIRNLRTGAPPGELALPLPPPRTRRDKRVGKPSGEIAIPLPTPRTRRDKPRARRVKRGGTQRIRRSVREIGRAMALAYLGRAAGTQAPSMFQAWASDRDFDDASIKAFSVRVLLTKSQLSDLQKTMKSAIGALNEAQTNPRDFFAQLKSASTAMGRNPSRVGQGAVRNLENSGLMGEYLQGLPYQSRLMSISQDDWMRMGVTEQQQIIDDARSKLESYQRFHDDTNRWIRLHAKDRPDDHVYAVPLDALP